MKMVIDIPKPIYDCVIGKTVLLSHVDRMCKAIEEGTPLTERPKGKWIKVDPLGTGDEAYMCSACKTGDWSVTVGEYKFCPYCGAEMDGGGKDEDGKSL